MSVTPPPEPSARAADTPTGAPVRSTAVVYCEANFGAIDGKTANGLVRHSEKYEILVGHRQRPRPGSTPARCSTSEPNGIPICADLADAVAAAGRVPDFFIFGMAPLERHALAASSAA